MILLPTYLVAVDSLGRVAAAGTVDRTSPVDERMKLAAMTQWVQDVRSVTTDGMAKRAAIDYLYAMIGSQSAAQTVGNGTVCVTIGYGRSTRIP